MAISNLERVGKGLTLLSEGLGSFVQRELKAAHGDRWEDAAKDLQRGPVTKVNWNDPQVILGVLWDQWNAVFRRTLGHAERSLTSELRDVRNRWAHRDTFSSNDTIRALDTMGRLLTAVSAAKHADAVEQIRMDLLRTVFDEQRRQEMRKQSFQPTEGKPQGGLKPWREIVTPHPDVASGRYQQAEFAADLWQVYLKEGSDEYRDPTEFFRRTFLTEGLTQLLERALQRLAGKGGDPVVELQTNFGGGKTHSMLALYHLFSGAPAGDLPGVEGLLKDLEVSIAQKVRRVVLVGTKISPGQPQKKEDGTVVHTLWGEIAWQLGGREGYELIRQADESGTNPGDVMKEIFNKYSPCLILIDEWIAYARQLHEGSELPAGSFATQFTFAQALSESAKNANQTLLVVSIPSSDNEIGGEWGQKALERLKNAVGRVESSWRPASPDEGFEIVRRRLFQPLGNEQAVARDAVARAFVEMYGEQHQEFPSECREADYERRIKMAYPIHPELFDRLYEDWSTLDKFQRTRGVLRLMASVIHSLWERQESNLLIMPASVSIDDQRVQFELTRYMPDPWVPVIEKDVDGSHSLPMEIDGANPNLGRYSACRRVARTIYMGSAPIQKAANRGIDDRRVKLGCVQPGESVATFGDALRRLTDRATYLYVDGNRYWYSTQPTVSRLADDRAGQLNEHDVRSEIEKRLRSEAKHRGDFSKVHACVTSGDIPDDREAKLIILKPDAPNGSKDADSPARRAAAAILENRGSSPRNYKNSLVFLAADSTRLKELEQAVQQFLAWTTIVRDATGDNPPLNLDNFQMRQAQTKAKTSDETVKARIPETYQWLIVPGQSDPKGDIEWTEIRLQGHETLATRSCKKMKNEELLFVGLGGARLRHELDRVPLWRGDHVGVKQLLEDSARYLYLPRLRDEDVLFSAIRDGVGMLTWQSDTFAYAEAFDEEKSRYTGLKAGESIRVLNNASSVLVKPDIAAAQLEADRQETRVPTLEPTATDKPTGGGDGELLGGGSTGGGVVAPPVPQLRRFHGSAKIDPVRMGRDAGQIAEEVLQHLTSVVGSKVEVLVEIMAELPEGASEKLVRDVTENCRTLKFDSYGFEEV